MELRDCLILSALPKQEKTQMTPLLVRALGNRIKMLQSYGFVLMGSGMREPGFIKILYWLILLE